MPLYHLEEMCHPDLIFWPTLSIWHLRVTHWGRVTHICVSNITIIGSDNGLSPGQCQAITWTNVGILLIGPLETNFSEMLIEIHTFSFKKIHLKMASAKWRPFCLGLNVLKAQFTDVFVSPGSVARPQWVNKRAKIFWIFKLHENNFAEMIKPKVLMKVSWYYDFCMYMYNLTMNYVNEVVKNMNSFLFSSSLSSCSKGY